jgi:hypothetical protein
MAVTIPAEKKASSPVTKKPAKPVDDKVHVLPHLVRGEFLVSVLAIVVLVVWSLLVDAPLEEPSNPSRTPNPSKAPWYFLGLQEMLVYFDPWLAGVVFPTLIIVGLMVIPFIDTNPRGNGYYSFKPRKYEILTFFFGFHILWVTMIMIGTFFRGPGWNWFWPWQEWDVHKVPALTNVDLPYFVGLRDPFWSMVFGAVVVLGYLAVGVGVFYLAVRRIKGEEFLKRWGMIRFNIVAVLFVLMAALPIKIILRLALHIKYIWVIPQFGINI